MLSRFWAVLFIASCCWVGSLQTVAGADAPNSDNETIASITIDTGRPAGSVAVIAGRDGAQQLIVTGVTDSGKEIPIEEITISIKGEKLIDDIKRIKVHN